MANPSIVNTTQSDNASCVTSRNISFNAGSCNYLLVWAFWYGCSGEWVNQPTISYNGVGATQIVQTKNGWAEKGGLYRLWNPYTGGAATLAMGNGGSYGARSTILAASFANVDDEGATATGSLTINLGSGIQSGDLSTVWIQKASGTSTWTDLAGQTNVFKRQSGDRLYAFSYEAGEDILGWTGTAETAGGVVLLAPKFLAGKDYAGGHIF